MEVLEKLAENHKLWLKILAKIGCPNHLAEDIVQDFYIKVYEKPEYHHEIIKHDKVNSYYIYAILRNMFVSHIRTGKKHMYPYIDWDVPDDSDDINDLELECSYLDYLKDRISETLEKLSRPERQLYYLHFVKGYSQRQISRETGEGLRGINNTCLNIKRVLRAALFEDAQDFYNQDYNFKI